MLRLRGWQEKSVQARVRSLDVAHGARGLQDCVAKMECARGVEEVARVSAEVLGGGSVFLGVVVASWGVLQIFYLGLSRCFVCFVTKM